MSVLDQRQRERQTSKSPSPSPSSFLLRTGGVSPTRRTSSRRLSSRGASGAADSPLAHTLRRSTSRKISRSNPPHVNNDIAKSQFATMNSRPHTPIHHDAASTDTSTTLVNPTSTILQGLIKEQRATRGSRKMIPHLPEDIDRTPPTSHSHSHSQSHENSPSEKQRRINSLATSGLKQPRDMGMREMDNYVSKMNKLNFDLKLEIFHRTQQIASLEKKMERMHAMEEELGRMHSLEDELDELREVEENNQRLREANEQLQSELDRRDQAISEAVELICQLESKVEELQAGRSEWAPAVTTSMVTDGSTFIADDASEVCTPKAQVFVDIPDRTSSRRGTSRRPRKSPSFLREESRSTAALRSLFVAEENKSVRSISASTMATTLDSVADPPSPRLSILSECSYFSPQDLQSPGTEFDQLDRLDQLNMGETGKTNPVASPTNAYPIGRLSDRISDWMQLDEHVSEGGINSNNRPRARALSDISRGAQIPATRLDEPFQPIHIPKRNRRFSPRQQHLPDFGGNLPPTPDTMSTFRPGFGNGSNASLFVDKLMESRAAINTSPTTLTRLNRPRSADELTTRPSPSLNGHSDTFDTAASVDSQHNTTMGNQDHVSSLLSSFNHFGRGSAKATRVLGPGSPSNPRLSCYGGDLLFNGEGVENVTPMHMTRTPSFTSLTPVKISNELHPLPLTPQEWLEAGRTEVHNATDGSNIQSDTEEKLLESPQMEHVVPRTTDDVCIEDSTPSRNPPLRLRAWANDESQTVVEAQPRRRLSLRPRFFSRNRHQQEYPSEPTTPSHKGPSPVPDKSISVSKHRRTSSGPGPNSEALVAQSSSSATGKPSNRPLPKPLAELRPSTASRPMTSDSGEPRSKGSLLLSWMKGSHSKDVDIPPAGHAVSARTGAERPKSTATIDIATLNLARAGELAPPAVEEEPVWRARRRSRRMA